MFIAKISDKNYLDLAYLKKFLLIFGILYGFNYLFIALITPKSFYWPFLDQYLNYISWLTIALLHTSNWVAQILGLNSFVPDDIHLQVVNGTNVYVGIPCLGLGVMIFWIAFIMSAGEGWRKKILWCVGGLTVIWLINSIRVAFILMAYQNKWNSITTMDHHTAFNVLAYAFIFVLIWLFYRKDEKHATGTSV